MQAINKSLSDPGFKFLPIAPRALNLDGWKERISENIVQDRRCWSQLWYNELNIPILSRTTIQFEWRVDLQIGFL